MGLLLLVLQVALKYLPGVIPFVTLIWHVWRHFIEFTVNPSPKYVPMDGGQSLVAADEGGRRIG